MIRSRNEHTLAQPCEVSGRGYWTGDLAMVRILPGKVGSGIHMVRTDLPGEPSLKVCSSIRQDHELRTVLAAGPVKFAMIEHLMASLYALEIDNCVVEIDREEFPGLDGSANAYVQALRSSGLVIQAAPRTQIVVDRTVRVGTAAHWVEVSPSHDGRAYYEYHLDYGEQGPIPCQTYKTVLNPDIFSREVAPSRTFVTSQQAAQLKASGVASHVTNQDLLVFDDKGVVDNALRYPDECSRHKTLDLIGDLALVGIDLIGRFVSYRGGHTLNAVMAEQLSKMARRDFCFEHRQVA